MSYSLNSIGLHNIFFTLKVLRFLNTYKSYNNFSIDKQVYSVILTSVCDKADQKQRLTEYWL